MSKRMFVNLMIILVIIMVIALLWATFASATTAEDLLKNPNITAEQRDAIAKAMQSTGANLPSTLKDALQWNQMGEAFAQTIKSICNTLNVEVNAFLKSDVGKLTAAVIIYRMVGKDILTIVLYIGAVIFVTIMIFSSLLIFHKKKRVVDKDKDGAITVSYVERFEWANEEIRTASLIIHLVVWFGFTAIVVGNII